VSATAEPWYERDPARREWELEEFERQSLPAEVSVDGQGRLVVKTELPFRDEPAAITVVYPHGYPFFPPEVTGAARLLDRHQDPVSLNYCLLESPSRDWNPSRSAGRLVGKNLRSLLKDTEKGPAAIRAGEARMAEPESAYFPKSDKVVLVGEPFLTNAIYAASGAMTIRRCAGHMYVLVEAARHGRIDDATLARFPAAGTDVHGRWVDLWGRPTAEDFPQRVLEAIAAADERIFTQLEAQLKRAAKGLPEVSRVVGLTFLEEGPTRDMERRNWRFIEVVQKRGYKPTVRGWPAQTQALSRAERGRRLPELGGLAEARVIVVGAGSLGAPVAVELAKSGVARLDILDCDTYDINNTVRHVLPGELAGEAKATGVADYCASLNPFLETRGYEVCLGDSIDAQEILDELLASASVVVDTTGGVTVSRYLAAQTRSAGVPLVVAGLTAGAHGGDLLLIEDDGPCLECFLDAQEEGRVPRPPRGEPGEETPIGCRDAAFTGAGFEATELAAIATRAAVRAIGLTQYPDTSSNWIVLNYRGEPHYQEGRLNLDADCEH
jgi:molybdopterin/thiamine biosynthesis adenylyltransferase